MSGRSYQIFMAPAAHKRFKKYDKNLQERIKKESEKISENPLNYKELKGTLKDIRSYHFNYSKTQYRIAYRVIESEKEIEILLVKSRESFYQTLSRIIKKSQIK